MRRTLGRARRLGPHPPRGVAAGHDHRRPSGPRSRCCSPPSGSCCCSAPSTSARWCSAARSSGRASWRCARPSAPRGGSWCASCSSSRSCWPRPGRWPGWLWRRRCCRCWWRACRPKCRARPRSRSTAACSLAVLAASVGLAVAMALLPALVALRPGLQPLLRQRHGTDTPGRQRALGGLVAAQVALALVLGIGAGLMLRSMWNLQRVDPGFDPDGVLAFRLQTTSKYRALAVGPAVPAAGRRAPGGPAGGDRGGRDRPPADERLLVDDRRAPPGPAAGARRERRRRWAGASSGASTSRRCAFR